MATSCRDQRLYKLVGGWRFVSPLVWIFKEKLSFIQFTLVGNNLQVVLIPILPGDLLLHDGEPHYVGAKHRDRWWENLFAGLLFAVALRGSRERSIR